MLVFPGLANLTGGDDSDAPDAPDAPMNIDLKRDFAIIHTSGTSGRPKAAILTYNNIFQSALGSAFRLGLLPDDRWLCVLPTLSRRRIERHPALIALRHSRRTAAHEAF